ncbi:MAG: hypothetical protein ACOYB2_11150 [Limnohabitans sp.]
MAGKTKVMRSTPMTVRQLIEALQAANPDLPVIVDCENRCDPHPVTGAHVSLGSETEDVRFIANVRLFADDRTDFAIREFKDDPYDTTVDGDGNEVPVR